MAKVFVSHSHADNEYCRVFVAALCKALGESDAVWYDEHNLGWGNIRRTIERELEQRQHFVAILSPAAVESDWVNDEIDAARDLLREGKMLTVLFVTAAQCDVPRLLRGYKRLELPGGKPYPPDEAARRYLDAIIGQGHDALVSDVSESQPRDILPPLGQAPIPARSESALHLTPKRLHDLGFRGYTIGNVEFILPPICPVPAGIFTMGSDKRRDLEAEDSEMPQHLVDIAAFAISQHPVTVAEYDCAIRAEAVRDPYLMGNPTWQDQLEHPDHPAVGITWNDALTYTAWLANFTGQLWRLPTEAEWEKAARGTDERTYPWGDIFDNTLCNTAGSSGGTTSVGAHPNGECPYQAQDMIGNVWEWTMSMFLPYPYRNNDGREARGSIENRVLRGSSWDCKARIARTAFRFPLRPDVHISGVGFRLALGVASN